MILGGVEVNYFAQICSILEPKFFDNPLNLSLRRSLLYKNQSIDLHSKSMDWFLYDRNLHSERDKQVVAFLGSSFHAEVLHWHF